jgi:hypothetical protein
MQVAGQAQDSDAAERVESIGLNDKRRAWFAVVA